MLKSYEASGPTIEAAKEAALKALGIEDSYNVSYEVLEKPKSGFLGIGAAPAKVKVFYEESPLNRAEDFVKGVLERLGVSARAELRADEDERTIYIELFGDDMGVVIGRRGDTLDAIQYLCSLASNKDNETHYRVVIDTENYRAKREESITALAQKMAGKVLKYKKPVSLEPMKPYERRVIHSALQDYKGITTYSTGAEPNRRVVVAIAGAPRRYAAGSQGKPHDGRGKFRPPVGGNKSVRKEKPEGS